MWIASNVVTFTWKLLFRFHRRFFFLESFMWRLAASATDRWFNGRTRWSVEEVRFFFTNGLHVLAAYVKWDVNLPLRSGLFPRLVPFAFFELVCPIFSHRKAVINTKKSFAVRNSRCVVLGCYKISLTTRMRSAIREPSRSKTWTTTMFGHMPRFQRSSFLTFYRAQFTSSTYLSLFDSKESV